jgi:hypothetical protein
MKPKLTNTLMAIVLPALLIFSCRKEDLPITPAKPSMPQKPAPTPDTVIHQPAPVMLKVAVKASIKVGEINYDSIPAQLTIKHWDSAGAVMEKQVQLKPGTNQLEFPNNTAKIYLKMKSWAVENERTIEREELNRQSTILLHASKKARRLKEESSFYLAAGNYNPQGKQEYEYNEDGTLFNVRYWKKEVHQQELQWIMNERFYYTSGKLTEIKKYQFTPNAQPIVTRINYDASGRLASMFQDSYGVITNASVEYGVDNISIYHSYNNGHSMTYNMEFAGGNKVKEEATTSRGGGEGGTFQYDLNINPFAHMNFPDLLLSKSSKNNMINQQKGYGGAFPSLVPYKWEYTYDDEGYPTQLLQHFKTGGSGEHFKTVKYVYTYETL